MQCVLGKTVGVEQARVGRIRSIPSGLFGWFLLSDGRNNVM